MKKHNMVYKHFVFLICLFGVITLTCLMSDLFCFFWIISPFICAWWVTCFSPHAFMKAFNQKNYVKCYWILKTNRSIWIGDRPESLFFQVERIDVFSLMRCQNSVDLEELSNFFIKYGDENDLNDVSYLSKPEQL